MIIPRICLCSILLALTASPAPAAEEYLSHEKLTSALQRLERTNSSLCKLQTIGKTGKGRAIHLLTLASDLNEADGHPAVLVTAGLDGRHRVGTETALRVAENILDSHSDMLEEVTIYVVSCANPDGASALIENPLNEHQSNMRPVDEDRDGELDEDGPEDLNGDGLITTMRRHNPPLDDEPTHALDPDEPRLLKKPDPDEGERAEYSLYTEGKDNDDDGLINEDPPGGIDPDKNFPHRWPEHDLDAGLYQLSEAESSALAEFVLDHPNIVAAVTYGRHDNLVNPPDSKSNDVTGRAPKQIHKDDATLYENVSEVYKELTDLETSPQVDSAGSFHAWLYAQRGIPSFATVVWDRPKPETKDEEDNHQDEDTNTKGNQEPDDTDPTLTPSGYGDISQETIDELMEAAEARGFEVTDQMMAQISPAQIEQFAAQAGIEVQRVSDDGEAGDSKRPGKREGDAAWLAYSDEQRDGEGFVEWESYDHPTLGEVEIGGFVPGFKFNPLPETLDDLGAKQTEFVLELADRRPKLSFEGPEINKLASGLYEIRFAVVNDGIFPTATAMASNARAIPPTIVRLSVPVERIVAGSPIDRTWAIPGNGGRIVKHWIVRADDGEELSIHIDNILLGDQTIEFSAEDK